MKREEIEDQKLGNKTLALIWYFAGVIGFFSLTLTGNYLQALGIAGTMFGMAGFYFVNYALARVEELEARIEVLEEVSGVSGIYEIGEEGEKA